MFQSFSLPSKQHVFLKHISNSSFFSWAQVSMSHIFMNSFLYKYSSVIQAKCQNIDLSLHPRTTDEKKESLSITKVCLMFDDSDEHFTASKPPPSSF